MNPSLKKKRESSLTLRLLPIVVLILGLLGVGAVLTTLRSDEQESHQALSRANAILLAVRTVDGLEWRAVAGEEPEEIQGPLATARTDIRETLADDGSSTLGERRLRSETGEYLDAVNDLLTAIEEDRGEEAEEIDETRVDPAFERVLSTAEGVVEDRLASETAARRAGALVSGIALATLGVILAVVLYVSFGRYEHRARARSDQRIRALISSSPDVMTIVEGEDELTLLSPRRTDLAHFVGEPPHRRVRDMLEPRDYERWRGIDQRIRKDGRQRSLEVIVNRTTGVARHFEGRGTTLDGDPTLRSWVWQDVTLRKELELQLSHQAFHDSLTGVANRALLVDRIAQALRVRARTGAPLALLFCDLDDFKTINDTLGHDAGDTLIKLVARRIGACLRPGDTLARLGGDEFAILLDDADAEVASAVADRVIAAVGTEAELGAKTVHPSLSAGIAIAAPGMSVDDLLRNADLAMYSAKRSGKGRAEAYTDRLHLDSAASLELQSDLKSALGRGELRLHYQPTIDLANGQVIGVEALLRWEHPAKGMIPPAEFIPAAEASGTILPIGRWVLKEACRAGAELQTPDGPPLVMAVNLSPHQLRDPSIIKTVSEALRASRLRPSLLMLEVTEGALLADPIAVTRLHELQQLGVEVAVDDFGTGYASINYLQTLPISTVKIDRSFVSGDGRPVEERQAVLNAIVDLTRSLKLRSVGEGIEDEQHLMELRELGCEVGQGFLWSPAVPLGEVRAAIDRINSRISAGV